MASPPEDLPGVVAWLVRKVTEIERRAAGRQRRGIVAEVNAGAGLFRVDFAPGYRSPWIPALSPSGGALRIQAEPTVGQSVLVDSPSGDMTDAVIIASGFTDDNARPHDQAGEFALDVGGTRIVASGDRLILQSNGSSIELDSAGVRVEGARIDLN